MNPQKLSQRVKELIGNVEMYDELLLIVATAREENATILTKDEKNLSYEYVPNKSGRIDDVWIESNYRR